MTMLRKVTCILTVMGGMLAAASSAFAQQATPLFAVLNGGNVCNGASPPVCRKGDLNGFGSATIIFPTATSVCFAIAVGGLAGKPTAAHLELGTPGINSGVLVVLTPPATGNPGASSACVSGVLATIISAVRADPTKFFVDVHTTTFPAAAIRGQLQ